jgi:class 3 adenylate cyclase/tetratricopeptide (TPR) repeat protein
MHCAQCGTLAVEGSRFCSNCGAPLVAPRPTEGERKLVTVLFADVVGSTAMAEKLDPEQIGEMMAGAFGFMNAAVARYGGTVSRLMGDAILALFGAPVAHEDDPERAVRAALDIRDAAERYKHSVRQVFGVEFQVRVGIHTGLAVLATVGDAIRAEYTAMGDTPNVAARVQSAAQPGTVLVTASTLRHVRDLVVYTDHEPIQAKGRSQPLELYVVDAIQERGHARGVAGLKSPLVGRDAEMALLRSLVDGLAEGRSALAVVSAEAGLGKSRLVAELAAGRPRGVTWLEGRAFSYGQSMVHAVWRDLFRTDIGSTAAESPAAVRAHLHARTRALGLSTSDVAAIETVLGVQSSTSQMQTLTEEGLVQERARLPDLDYIFKHALTQEAAYELLLLRRRRDLHRRTGLAMESFYAERTDELAPVLARHFFEGDEWRRAARYAAEGAQRALDVYHGSEALELRDLACKANDRDPDAPALETCDAILSWAEIAFKVRTREEILGRLERAEKIARDSGDDSRLAQTLNWIGNAHIMAGFPGDGMPPLLEAFELARKLDDERLLLLPLFLTTLTIVDADPAAALGKLDEVIDASRKFKNRDVEAHTLASKAQALARLGRFAEAGAAIDEALHLAQLTGSPIKLADVNSMAGLVFIALGDAARATEHGRIDAGQLSAAVPLLETAIAFYSAKGMLPAWLEALEALANVREAQGNAGATTHLRHEITQLSTRIQPAPPELRA